MTYAIIAILLFYAIVFIQSGYDKVTDWQGNLGWLKGHFSQTFLKNTVPQALFIVLVMEVLSGAFSVTGHVPQDAWPQPRYCSLSWGSVLQKTTTAPAPLPFTLSRPYYC